MLQSIDLWLLPEKKLFINTVPSVQLNDKSKGYLDLKKQNAKIDIIAQTDMF